jgi:serine/threonine protein kinase
MNKKTKNTVFDKNDNAYQLKSRVGEGGQGVVCTTQFDGVLVKILNTKDEKKIKTWKKQISWCLRQDLSDLNLALPKIQITKPRVGYVLELMDGLIPLQDVLELSFNDLVDNNSVLEFIKTGGLKRRLQILLKVAQTLSELHSRGYAYGDISPANIFVSKDAKYSETWFIDCDNLCFNEREGHTHLYTPGYGAPEVVKNEMTVSCLTDEWSFAVMAFELLTHQHPFKGIFVEDGEPEIVEEQVYRGELPWVYDSTDDSNESSGGISLDKIANQKLISLFTECFELGKNEPYKRPSLNKWRDALQESLDQLIDCPGCNSHYFYIKGSEEQTCPFCPTVIGIESYAVFEQVICCADDNDAENNEKIKIVPTNIVRVICNGNTLSFNAAPYNTELWFNSETNLSVSVENGDIYFIPQSNAVCKISRSKSDKEHQFTKKQRIPVSKRDADDPYQLMFWPKSAEEDAGYKEILASYRWQVV